MKRSPLKRIGMVAARRNKFGAVPRFYNGIEYHSHAEASYAALLDLRTKALPTAPQAIKSWRRQVPVKLEVNGQLITTYIVDFVATHHDGREEWIEVKGFATPEWRIKEKLFRALYPDRMLTVVAARSNYEKLSGRRSSS